MTAHLEIEKKYQIVEADVAPLLTKFDFVSEKRIIDNYFDTYDGDNCDGRFYKDGIFIRIRNQQTLDIKFNPDHLGKSDVTDHVSCAEYSFQEPFADQDVQRFDGLGKLIGLQHPLGTTFSSFLDSNQLKTLLRIDKVRKTYKNQRFILVIDSIEGLGTFLEIEYAGENENPDIVQIVSEIDRLMAGIPATPLATGSFEMLLRKQNYDLYQQGKYLLETDMGSTVTTTKTAAKTTANSGS